MPPILASMNQLLALTMMKNYQMLLIGTLYLTTWLMSSTMHTLIVHSLIMRHKSRLTTTMVLNLMESIIQLRNDEKFAQVPNLN